MQKFVSKFGKNLADGATEAILAKVTEVFQDIQDQRAVVKAEGNPQGRNQDYLEQRKNLDSLENINRELNQS